MTVGVHARAVIALDRLRHEGRGLAVLMRDVVHHVFVDLQIVGGAHQGRETKPNSCCDGATSWWCFSTWSPMSNITTEHGHRPPIKGGYFPVPPDRRRLRPARRDAVGDVRHGAPGRKHHHEVAPSQHDWLCLLDPGAHRRQSADLQIRGAQRRASIRQDRDLHAEADQGR